jgi:hypothetical protein
MITLTPDLVGNPGLPSETPKVRIRSPSFVTVIRCLAFDTRITKARPIRKAAPVSRMPHSPGPAWTLRRSAVTVTPVWAGQNVRGRNCTVRDDVQDHAAGPTAGVVVTCSAASTSALRRTRWLNVTTSGRPTPTLRPFGEMVARSTRSGAPVRTVVLSADCWPSGPTAVAASAYVVRGTRLPVLAQRAAMRSPRTWRPSGPVRVTAVRVPPVALTTTGLSSAHSVAPAAGLAS